jgi:adenylate cyclase
MPQLPDVESDVDAILIQAWTLRDGSVVPASKDVVLQGGGVRLTATMLYADLADSTGLVRWDRRVAARVFKAYLTCCTRLILHRGGYVRSFDGDRVMGVFVGPRKNSESTHCALNINFAFETIIRLKFEARYPAIADGTRPIGHCVGIDTGPVLVVRSGLRDNNDLLWVGQAANIAAKLSAIREAPNNSFISKSVYDAIDDLSKYDQGGTVDMWEPRIWNGKTVFRSAWYWGS